MRPFRLIAMLGTVALLLGQAAAQPSASNNLSLGQYVQALDDALAQARQLANDPESAAALRDALPGSWRVRVDDKTFEIPTETIRRDLGAWQAKPDDATLGRIVLHLETLRAEADGYHQSSAEEPSHRALLDHILARSEFQRVHGPTWIDRLKQRFTELLIRILGRAITSSAIPAISNVVVYGLIALAVAALAWWMYRSLRESARLETIMPVAVPISAKEWPVWLSEARAAAARSLWREAVHLCYWAAISFLEAQGSWRPDAARTPREYLRILPPASAHQLPLRSLTENLERVWYGMQPADADSFRQTLTELENLGCPCN